MSTEIITVSEEELSLVENNSLNAKQLQVLLKTTPKKYIKQRPAKGGGQWAYVSGGYVRKVLNIMFGWDWDFEIIDDRIQGGEAIVKGRLTVRSAGRTIVKTQYGNKEIMCKRGTEIPLSLGNDLKAAATDALKKCAAELGIAADVYTPHEFTAVNISNETDDEVLEKLIKLRNEKEKLINKDDLIRIDEIISEQEVSSYKKAINTLNKL